jgi:nicotinate-nucleotide--dimethylbenzimidazole phosphoribosyltransferase
VFAKANHVHLCVVDVGVLGSQLSSLPLSNVLIESPYKLPFGTKNACIEPAMTIEECEGCMQAGREIIQQHYKNGTKLFVLGEVGIGNTTTSSLLLAALTGIRDIATICDGGATVGREVDLTVVHKKIHIVEKALQYHRHLTPNDQSNNPGDILARYGGAEIAALVGAILEAAHFETLVVIDGFIVTVAAAYASTINALTCQYMLFASRSTERGYDIAFQTIVKNAAKATPPIIMQTKPALDMNLRMGEGTAGLLVVPIIRNAVDMLCQLATIEDILSSTSTTTTKDEGNTC